MNIGQQSGAGYRKGMANGRNHADRPRLEAGQKSGQLERPGYIVSRLLLSSSVATSHMAILKVKWGLGSWRNDSVVKDTACSCRKNRGSVLVTRKSTYQGL